MENGFQRKAAAPTHVLVVQANEDDLGLVQHALAVGRDCNPVRELIFQTLCVLLVARVHNDFAHVGLAQLGDAPDAADYRRRDCTAADDADSHGVVLAH